MSALNLFIKDRYSLNHSVSEYHVYEFFKVPPSSLNRIFICYCRLASITFFSDQVTHTAVYSFIKLYSEIFKIYQQCLLIMFCWYSYILHGGLSSDV